MPDRKDFGDILVRKALTPVHRASMRLREGEIGEGLNALAKAELYAGLKEGVAKVAALFHLPPRDVESMLPWSTIMPALDRVETAHEAAVRAFVQYAATVGGFLTGFAGGTDVGTIATRQSAGDALENVAKRFVRDKGLHRPLAALAVEVKAWEALIARCGDELEASPLWGRIRRRQMLSRALVVVVALVGLGAGAVVLVQRSQLEAARARVEALLGAADPCVAETIPAADAARATPAQLSRAGELRKTCTDVRARKAYEDACEALAKEMETGALSKEGEALAKEAAPRLARAAKKELATDDLLATEKDMPCQDTESKRRMFRAYAAAAAASKAAWTDATRVSDDLKKALLAKELEGSLGFRDEIGRRAEAAAHKAIMAGKPEQMAKAKGLCELYGSLGGVQGKKCTGLLALMK